MYVGAVVVAAVGVGLLFAAGIVVWGLWERFRPPHWQVSGPSRARPAGEVFARTDYGDSQAASFRRWVRVGPWGVYVVRYAPAPDAEEGDGVDR